MLLFCNYIYHLLQPYSSALMKKFDSLKKYAFMGGLDALHCHEIDIYVGAYSRILGISYFFLACMKICNASGCTISND